MEKGLMAIGAALAVFTGFSQGLGEARVAAQAIESMARNPEMEGSIRSTMIMGIALTETTGIYGLVVAILILFVL